MRTYDRLSPSVTTCGPGDARRTSEHVAAPMRGR
jgi:hypothetical protein